MKIRTIKESTENLPRFDERVSEASNELKAKFTQTSVSDGFIYAILFYD
jgi:hypothetical protein